MIEFFNLLIIPTDTGVPSETLSKRVKKYILGYGLTSAPKGSINQTKETRSA
jgi:hypothetical protein